MASVRSPLEWLRCPRCKRAMRLSPKWGSPYSRQDTYLGGSPDYLEPDTRPLYHERAYLHRACMRSAAAFLGGIASALTRQNEEAEVALVRQQAALRKQWQKAQATSHVRRDPQTGRWETVALTRYCDRGED